LTVALPIISLNTMESEGVRDEILAAVDAAERSLAGGE
jgi:hypothetical protein